MRILLPALPAFVIAAPALAQQAKPAPILTTPEAKDVWTHAQPEVARVTHVGLDLTADFQRQTRRGPPALDALAAKGAKQIVLDVDDLAIASIPDAAGKP